MCGLCPSVVFTFGLEGWFFLLIHHPACQSVFLEGNFVLLTMVGVQALHTVYS